MILLLLMSNFLIAQSFTLTGKVSSSKNSKALIGANVFIKKLNKGTAAGNDGKFTILNIPEGQYNIKFSYVGFSEKIIKIKINKNTKLDISLDPKVFSLSETIIKGKRAELRETPIAFSNVDAKQITTELGSRYITSSLEKLPSLYDSDEGGGFADSRLSIRGYDQTSIAVMINGIPINNPENGEIYWSNWADISDVVRTIQVQRGLSATPYSVSSIGGVVNVITNSGLTNKKFFKITSQIGADNFRKVAASFQFPIINNKIQMIGMISRAKWGGYADQTWADLFSYYFSLGMLFGKQSLEIQFMGSPQKHGQRITPHRIDAWNKKGLRYNSDWGYLHGKPLNARDNEFNKPSLTINHIWQISKNTILTNVLYLSHAKGGGHVPPWNGFESTLNGSIDFDKIWTSNSANIDSNYSYNLSRSTSALRFTYHIHNWAAFRSTIYYNQHNFKYSFGLDGKYYFAKNYSTLGNLLGGDYYIGSGNVNQNPKKLLFAGDKVDYDADSYVRSFGGFGQVEFNTGILNSYLNVSFAITGYDRIDYFNYKNYDPKRETGWKSFSTYTVKSGVNVNISKSTNIYFNIGNFSKAPLSMNVYTYTNDLFKYIKNENIFSTELGYGFNYNSIKLNVNLFYTLWKDKALNFNVFLPDSYSFFHANVYGGKSLHKGIEATAELTLLRNFSLNGMFSIASYKWLNDVKSYLIPEGNVNEQIVFDSKIKDLYEGNSPMTKIGFGIKYKLKISSNVDYYLNTDYIFYGRYYAQFDPVSRSFNNEENVQSWRIPDFYTVNLHSGISIKGFSEYFDKINLRVSVFNVLNSKNIIRASDGNGYNSNSALVWYNRERWVSGTLSVEF